MGLTLIEKIFIRCGGGDFAQLQQNNIQPDTNKIVGIGGAVLFTGLFAAFSFGFAMSWVFKSTAVCVLLGIIWGLMIFNLDRLIVSGSIKTAGNKFCYYINFIVRLALAVAISLIISVPLELQLFESLLVNETIKIEQKDAAAIKTIEADIVRLDSLYRYETAGKGIGNGSGEGPVAKGIKQRLQTQESNLELQRASVKKQYTAVNNTLGLLERYRALVSLQKSDIAIYRISLGITILILLIEIIPILVKTFATDGAYDDSMRYKIDKLKETFV